MELGEYSMDKAINNVFNNYFIKHHFIEDTNFSSRYSRGYRNDYCIFLFSRDYAEINLDIQKPGDNYKYNLFSIHLYLTGVHLDAKDIPSGGLEDKWTKALTSFKGYIEKTLPNLPAGDFSWANGVKEMVEFDTLLWSKLLSLPKTNPIYIKYSIDDPSWKADVTKLLKSENLPG